MFEIFWPAFIGVALFCYAIAIVITVPLVVDYNRDLLIAAIILAFLGTVNVWCGVYGYQMTHPVQIERELQ